MTLMNTDLTRFVHERDLQSVHNVVELCQQLCLSGLYKPYHLHEDPLLAWLSPPPLPQPKPSPTLTFPPIPTPLRLPSVTFPNGPLGPLIAPISISLHTQCWRVEFRELHVHASQKTTKKSIRFLFNMVPKTETLEMKWFFVA